MTTSAKPLFQATKRKRAAHPELFPDTDLGKPRTERDPLDYDPTPFSATEALIGVEIDHIRAHGGVVWETAVGGGHIADVLTRAGFTVIGTDVMHRGWWKTEIASFFDHDEPRAPIEVTNPPYNRISARDGGGAWLRHGQEIGLTYRALLLNADWPAARINGMDELLRNHPPSIEYLCCWKIDFRGGGAPPQRNSWFIWDTKRPVIGPGAWVRKRLFRGAPDGDQAEMFNTEGSI